MRLAGCGIEASGLFRKRPGLAPEIPEQNVSEASRVYGK